MLATIQIWALMLLQESGGVSFDPLSMWNQMTWLGKAVVITMFIMSAWSIGVMIDRLIAYQRGPEPIARSSLRRLPARCAKASSTKQSRLLTATRRATLPRSSWPVCRNSVRTRTAAKFPVKRSKLPSAPWIAPKPLFTPN